MKHLITLTLAVCLLGCGQRGPKNSDVESKAGIAAESGQASTETADSTTIPTSNADSLQNAAAPAESSKRAESLSEFEYPSDLTGKVVVRAVAPETPALTPNERFGKAPKPRAVPTKISNPESISKADSRPPPILPVKPLSVSISPPPERVPFDLGRGADAIPARPTLPIAAAITERARDVNLPPSMPILGRPLNERVSLDDPTSEFANAAIVAPSVNVPLKSAEFVKVTLPDPFELGEQVKPKVPLSADPGLAPVTANPQRVK